MSRRTAIALIVASLSTGCSGSGGQGNPMVPFGTTGSAGGAGGSGNTIVRIYVPAGAQVSAPPKNALPTVAPAPPAGLGAPPGLANNAPLAPTPPVTTPPPAPGSQNLAINVNGPAAISQNVSVGPNASGCAPSGGGSATCQLALSLPAGTYAGTVGSAAIAFTVAPGSNNSLNLTLGGVPSQLVIVPATPLAAQNAQGGIDLYGAGKHLMLIEMLDANQNVMVGGGASFAMSQAGGSLPLTMAQASNVAPNFFYVSAGTSANGSSAIVRATANYGGPGNPCSLSGAACTGTARVDVRQVVAVANSGANTVTMYVNGQSAPLMTVQSGVAAPQALAFDAAGDLFVANEAGSVTEYAPPYNQPPVVTTSGINHPQSLAIDAHGDLFVANGNGSNTVTVYAPPYGGMPSATISAGIDDPVSLALDASADLFVVNSSANTVTEYVPPYAGAPVTISKGLNTPNSLTLDSRGNLFVANLNSTPNSVVEYTPPFSGASAPVATITNGVNEQGAIAVLASSLFVPNQGANTVTEYAAPFTGTPTTIVGGQSQPVALVVDAAGDLFVANYGNNTVTEYTPPYAPGSWTTISTGITSPQALAIAPPTNGGPTIIP